MTRMRRDSPLPELRTDNEPAPTHLAEEAAEWLDRLQDADEKERCLFADWLTKSPIHIEEFLRMSALDHELEKLGDQAAISSVDSVGSVDDEVVAPAVIFCSYGMGKTNMALQLRSHLDPLVPPTRVMQDDPTPHRDPFQEQLYGRYRRTLLAVFLHRRIPRDAAEDLLQRTFLQAIKKIRTEGLDDPSNLGGYLYRTACKLATAYWRGELSRRHDNDMESLSNLKDDTLSLEERLDHEQLAKCVRDLMGHLPVQRDREVLERYYLREEPRAVIRQSYRLTDMQLNQLLWRARQRFGDILRRHGLAAADEFKDLSPATDAGKDREQSSMNVFISYAHQDRPILDRLHAHLGNLRKEGSISTWVDRDISAGTARGREATSQLENSKLFVPLVSADFLNSRYCYDMEMTKAFRLHETGKIKIVPVILEQCDWLSSPLRQFKTLPGDGKPLGAWDSDRAAFLEIASGLRQLARCG